MVGPVVVVVVGPGDVSLTLRLYLHLRRPWPNGKQIGWIRERGVVSGAALAASLLSNDISFRRTRYFRRYVFSRSQ